ncbi:TPA: hypothetical protein ACQD72_000748 [Yersinia enterocolitica]
MDDSKPLLLPHITLSTNTALRAGVLLTITDLAEWDHPYLFKVSATRFRHAHQLPELEENLLPLPSTQGICRFLQMAAQQHPFVYIKLRGRSGENGAASRGNSPVLSPCSSSTCFA